MKRKYLWFSSFCLLLYMILLYELWRLCQFGGVRRRLIVMIVAGVLFVISFLLWVVWYRAARQSVDWVKPPKWIFLGKLIFLFQDLSCPEKVLSEIIFRRQQSCNMPLM